MKMNDFDVEVFGPVFGTLRAVFAGCDGELIAVICRPSLRCSR